MAINIRYDNAGQLGQLAVQAGLGQQFNRRFAQGQSLVAAAQQNYAQQDALRLQAEAQRHKQQIEQSLLASRTPTQQSASSVGSPFSQSVKQAAQPPPQDPDQVSYTQSMFGAPPSEQGGGGYVQSGGSRSAVDATGKITNYVDTGGEQFQPSDEPVRGGNFVGGSYPRQPVPPDVQRKLAMLDASNLPEAVKEGLRILASDPQHPAGAFQIRLEQARQDENRSPARPLVSPAVVIQAKNAQLNLRLHELKTQLKDALEPYEPDERAQIVGRQPTSDPRLRRIQGAVRPLINTANQVEQEITNNITKLEQFAMPDGGQSGGGGQGGGGPQSDVMERFLKATEQMLRQ